MAFQRRYLRALMPALALAAILIVVLSLTTGGEDPALGQDETAQAEAEQPTEASESAESDAAEDESGEEEDPFDVPDASPEKLIEYIEQLETMDPMVRSLGQYQDHQIKVAESVVTAAATILSKEPSDEQAQLAALKMFEHLQTLHEIYKNRTKAVQSFMKSQVAKLVDDERPGVAKVASIYSLYSSVLGWPDLSKSQQEEFFEDLSAYYKQEGVDEESARLAVTLGRAMQEGGDQQATVQLYRTLGQKLAESEQEEIAAVGETLMGTARRLNLPGNKMELEGSLLSGKKLDWAAYRGKIVLVDFWATWCGPCIEEVPNLIENYENYRDRGFDIVGISLDGNPQRVEQAVEQLGMKWPIMFSFDEDASAMDHPMAQRYGIMQIPTTMLVGRDGKVLALDVRGRQLNVMLENLLGPAEEESADSDAGAGGAKGSPVQDDQ